MILLIVKKKGSIQERAFLLKKESDCEVVREIVMRLGCYLEDFEFRMGGQLTQRYEVQGFDAWGLAGGTRTQEYYRRGYFFQELLSASSTKE